MNLPNFTTAPPGQWRYTVPETGQVFGPFPGIEQLIDQLRQHYNANGLSVPDRMTLTDKIEEQTCARIPAYCGDANAIAMEQEQNGNPNIVDTFYTVMGGTKTLLSWLGNGRQLVEQDLADTRAATCAGCQFNITPAGCTNCNMSAFYNLIERIVGKRQTTSHEKIKACSVCHCGSRAKVWVPLDTILRNMPKVQQDKLPDHCWIKTEAQETETK